MVRPGSNSRHADFPHRPAGLLGMALMAATVLAAGPELHQFNPPGGQCGTDVAARLVGAHLENPQAILFYEPGIAAADLAGVDDKNASVRLTIAPDCALGEHHLRLRTASGWSELRTFWVGALPEVAADPKNNRPAAPQKIPLGCTVSGVIQNEHVDAYSVTVKAGQRLTAVVEGMRLGRAMFDPYLAIRDARQVDLVTCDDSSLLLQDPIACVIAPADGEYTVLIREASYGGSGDCHYRLHIGTFPAPSVAVPLGGHAGEKLDFQLRGDGAAPLAGAITLPATPQMQFPYYARDTAEGAVSPNLLWVSNLPTYVPPNTGSQPASAPAAATPPLAFDGVLTTPGATDKWRITARKDAALDVTVRARHLRSPLDSVLEICDAAGKSLASNDDANGPDSYLRFVPPADGEYELRVRDQRGRGSPLFAYRLEVAPPQPEINLTLDRVDSRRPQFLQALAVPRGNRMAGLLRVERKDIGGAVEIAAEGLPAGVSCAAATIGAEWQVTPIVFDATADAPLDGRLCQVHGRIAREGGPLTTDLRQDVPLVLGPPNDTVYYRTEVSGLAVAACEAVPFQVRLIEPPTPILRNGALQLQVLVERVRDFKGEITVQMLWNPPGISSSPNLTIPAEQAQGALVLNAAADAALRSYKVALLAHANLGGGDQWVSTQLVDLAIADRYFNGAIQLAATEPGKPVPLLCKLEPMLPLPAVGKVALLGLPPKTSAAALDVKPDDKELVFDVHPEADAPVGEHGGLFCELTTTLNGQPVTHRFAFNGKLRIDKPKPVEAAAAPPPPPGAAPPKPVSRLEQLRRSAAEKSGTPAAEKGKTH